MNTKHVLGYRKGNYIHLQSLFHHLVVWIHYIYIFFDMIKNNKVQGIPGPFYAAVTTSACATTAVLTARVWVGNSCLKLDHILIGGCHYLSKLCRTIYWDVSPICCRTGNAALTGSGYARGYVLTGSFGIWFHPKTFAFQIYVNLWFFDTFSIGSVW